MAAWKAEDCVLGFSADLRESTVGEAGGEVAAGGVGSSDAIATELGELAGRCCGQFVGGVEGLEM